MIMVAMITICYLFGIFKLYLAMLNPQGCPASYLLQKENFLISILFPRQSKIVAAFVSSLTHFFITSIYWLTHIYQTRKPRLVICPHTLIRRIPDNTLNIIFLSNMWVNMILNIYLEEAISDLNNYILTGEYGCTVDAFWQPLGILNTDISFIPRVSPMNPMSRIPVFVFMCPPIGTHPSLVTANVVWLPPSIYVYISMSILLLPTP